MGSGIDRVWKLHGDGRTVQPEVPPLTGIGDSLVEPLAQAPDRRRPGTA